MITGLKALRIQQQIHKLTEELVEELEDTSVQEMVGESFLKVAVERFKHQFEKIEIGDHPLEVIF